MERPLAVIFIAFYYAIFSAVLIAAVIGQLMGHHIHGSFKDLVVVLPMGFAVTLIPGLLAFGLWVMDNAARLGAILFAILHAVSAFAWLNQPHVPSKTFTVFRICLDAAIVILLCLPGVRKAFRWKAFEFSINDNAWGNGTAR